MHPVHVRLILPTPDLRPVFIVLITGHFPVLAAINIQSVTYLCVAYILSLTCQYLSWSFVFLVFAKLILQILHFSFAVLVFAKLTLQLILIFSFAFLVVAKLTLRIVLFSFAFLVFAKLTLQIQAPFLFCFLGLC